MKSYGLNITDEYVIKDEFDDEKVFLKSFL